MLRALDGLGLFLFGVIIDGAVGLFVGKPGSIMLPWGYESAGEALG